MIERIAQHKASELLSKYPILTITGPRQSGKSTLAAALAGAKPVVNLESPDMRRLALDDPRGLLSRYPEGCVFDEIQRAPELASYLQPIVDADQRPGRFVLTGSQQFELMNQVSQSLAGRTALLRLLPFSIEELHRANRLDSNVWRLIYTGFYPRTYAAQLNPTEAASFYVSTYLERDLRQLANIGDLATFERFLRLCAAHTGQLINASQLAADIGVSHKTISAWLSLLETSFIVFRLQPHHVNVKKRLVKTPKLYFYDPGLACFLLGISEVAQLEAHPLRGALFENLVIVDVMKARFNAVKSSNLYFYRDHAGLEVDLLLEDALGVRLVEIKSGSTFHPEFADALGRYGGKQVLERIVVYGGDQTLSLRDIQVRPWRSLAASQW